MNRLLLPSLFILFLTGLFGSNALARVNGEGLLLDPLGNIEQILEAEVESPEDTFGQEYLSGAGLDGDDTPDFPSQFSEIFSAPNQAGPYLTCQTASIRQSQINLLDSFQAPAIFILFLTYQGYLS